MVHEIMGGSSVGTLTEDRSYQKAECVFIAFDVVDRRQNGKTIVSVQTVNGCT